MFGVNSASFGSEF